LEIKDATAEPRARYWLPAGDAAETPAAANTWRNARAAAAHASSADKPRSAWPNGSARTGAVEPMRCNAPRNACTLMTPVAHSQFERAVGIAGIETERPQEQLGVKAARRRRRGRCFQGPDIFGAPGRMSTAQRAAG
jgi:hypothetical protein